MTISYYSSLIFFFAFQLLTKILKGHFICFYFYAQQYKL